METITIEKFASEHGVINLESKERKEVKALIGNVNRRDFSSYRLKTGNMKEVKKELLILCALYAEYLINNGFDSETYITCNSQIAFEIYGNSISSLLDTINPKFVLYLHVFDEFISSLI